ncbi:hypothetical protein RHS01_05380 [Rhizoctonia solani]|uniref:Uncharacterized protein n=1 Tax=Rhizoctonia solani TaxID=456999 RepID=A0A8H7IEN5_9AGAM|nr:hypothetical protein RHS01_05380 [Rhizoctonia solani]
MALMLRSLASSFGSERSQTCIDGLALSRTPSRMHRRRQSQTVIRWCASSPYPPLKRSSPAIGSGMSMSMGLSMGGKRPSIGQPLKRTASLHGGDSLASLEQAAKEAKEQQPYPKHKHKSRRVNGPLRPALSLANTLVLDPLVCPPPIPIPRHHIPVHVPTPQPKPTNIVFSQVRRRSSLAPEASAPTALIARTSQVALPSPPSVLGTKKKRESLAQRTIRRQFERTPRGAQVKTHGAHAAMRMMNEAEEEAAVAAVLVIDEASDSRTCPWPILGSTSVHRARRWSGVLSKATSNPDTPTMPMPPPSSPLCSPRTPFISTIRSLPPFLLFSV